MAFVIRANNDEGPRKGSPTDMIAQARNFQRAGSGGK